MMATQAPYVSQRMQDSAVTAEVYRGAMRTLSSGRRASISSADRNLAFGFSCSEILDGLRGSAEGVLLGLKPERILKRSLAAVGEQ